VPKYQSYAGARALDLETGLLELDQEEIKLHEYVPTEFILNPRPARRTVVGENN